MREVNLRFNYLSEREFERIYRMMRKESLLFQFNQGNPINRSSDKAHGGEIKVESKEDEGSEFVIQLPV